jgi:hypothetical protein
MKLIKKVFVFGVIIFSQILLNAEATPECGGNPGGNDPACWTSQKIVCQWETVGTIYNCMYDNVLCSDGYSNNNAQSCSEGRCDEHGGVGSVYGYFKQGNCGIWCTNSSEPDPGSSYTCHYIDEYTSWTQCVNGVQIGENPHWATKSGTDCENAPSTRRCPFRCLGHLDFDEKECPDTESDLTKDTIWHRVTNCTGASKCAYTKKAKCGSANEGEYETLTATNPNLCGAGFTANNFNDSQAELDGKWTWQCSKAGYDAVGCFARKKGECPPIPNPPYNLTDDACGYGKINRVSLSDGIFTWYCGTGGEDLSPGSFREVPSAGTVINVSDEFASSTQCTCTAGYTYSCQVTVPADCSNHCDEMATEIRTPFKKETACFPNEGDLIPVTREDYADNHASGQPATCENKQVQCPPCGVNAGGSGTVNETN